MTRRVTCKYCQSDTLRWQSVTEGDRRRFTLIEEDGRMHRCGPLAEECKLCGVGMPPFLMDSHLQAHAQMAGR